jgi:hypothetical protein
LKEYKEKGQEFPPPKSASSRVKDYNIRKGSVVERLTSKDRKRVGKENNEVPA